MKKWIGSTGLTLMLHYTYVPLAQPFTQCVALPVSDNLHMYPNASKWTLKVHLGSWSPDVPLLRLLTVFCFLVAICLTSARILYSVSCSNCLVLSFLSPPMLQRHLASPECSHFLIRTWLSILSILSPTPVGLCLWHLSLLVYSRSWNRLPRFCICVMRSSFVWGGSVACRTSSDIWTSRHSWMNCPLPLVDPYVLLLLGCSLKFTLGSLLGSPEFASLFVDPLRSPRSPSNLSMIAWVRLSIIASILSVLLCCPLYCQGLLDWCPLSTNDVTSGRVTLSIPGSFVLVEIRVLPLCLDVSSQSASGSAGGLLVPVILFFPGCTSELVMFTNSFDCCDPSMVLFIVLTTPNRSDEPVSLLVYCFIFVSRTVEA